MKFHTIESFKDKLSGKKVFVRVDTNATLENGRMPLTDRITEAFLTINKLCSYGASVILGAHNGREGEASFVSLGPLFLMLQDQHAELPKMICPGNTYDSDYLGLNNPTIDSIKKLEPGQILVLENLRFLKNETAKLSNEEFSQQKFVCDLLQAGVEYYVLDGFSVAHRAHMSIVGFSAITNIAGLAVEKELNGAAKVRQLLKESQTGNSQVTFLFGGAKIQDYFELMETALTNGTVTYILPGGLFSSLCLVTKGYDLGKTSLKPLEKKDSKGKSILDYQNKLRELIEKYNDKFVLPQDVAFLVDGERINCDVENISEKLKEQGAVLDIGEKTMQNYKEIIAKSSMAYWKGPLGAFDINPLFGKGSEEVLSVIKGNPNIFSVMGGGDTGQMLQKFNTDTTEISYVSLSGGALIEVLAGKQLPGIAALEESYAKNN